MLCELTTLKTRLGLPESDVVDNEILTSLIEHVSGRFARECNRIFDYSATATYEFRGDEMNIVVDRFPIISVASFHLKSNETDGFVAQTGVDYLFNSTKSIIELATPLGTSREIGKVTFAGGYVLPGGTMGAGQTALPDEIEHACVEQCAHWYQRRNQLGLTAVSGEGGSISQFAALDLLPNVRAVLKKHERWLP